MYKQAIVNNLIKLAADKYDENGYNIDNGEADAMLAHDMAVNDSVGAQPKDMSIPELKQRYHDSVAEEDAADRKLRPAHHKIHSGINSGMNVGILTGLGAGLSDTFLGNDKSILGKYNYAATAPAMALNSMAASQLASDLGVKSTTGKLLAGAAGAGLTAGLRHYDNENSYFLPSGVKPLRTFLPVLSGVYLGAHAGKNYGRRSAMQDADENGYSLTDLENKQRKADADRFKYSRELYDRGVDPSTY